PFSALDATASSLHGFVAVCGDSSTLGRDMPTGAALFASARLLIVKRAHRIDGIGVVGGLVRPIALETRKPQRETAWIVRALLQVVERDFGNEFWPDMDDVSIASDL